MELFLNETRLNVGNLSNFEKVKVVLGNESCDLDSAVSALIYSYLLRHTIGPSRTVIVLPVLNICEEDLPLRTEVSFFLRKWNVPLDVLIFRNQVDLISLDKAKKLELILVDHNVLPPSEKCLESVVVEVIDHHKRERWPQDGAAVTMEMVGSCCTLVAEKLLARKPALIDAVVGNLLYGTILLDTVCLSESARRSTPKDHAIVIELEGRLQMTAERRMDVFKELQTAKNDISGLSSLQLMRKDLKMFQSPAVTLAMSSFPILVKDYAKLPFAQRSLEQFSQMNDCNVVIMMGIETNVNTQNVCRDIAVYSQNGVLRDQIIHVLESSEEPPLFLDPLELEPPLPGTVAFNQGNTAASRKFVAPILKAFMEGEAGESKMGLRTQRTRQSSSGHSPDMLPASPVTSTMERELETDFGVPAPINDVFTPPLRTPNGLSASVVSQAAHFLGVGDPLSQGGSSQSSSAYNSCPYTPQNSCADDGVLGDPCPLPTFNSRDMMEKIELKRGKLRGYEGSDEEKHSYPFTPKNSFVESSFESAYQRMHQSHAPPEIDSEVILQKLYEKQVKVGMEVSEEVDEEDTENNPPAMGEMTDSEPGASGRGGNTGAIRMGTARPFGAETKHEKATSQDGR